MARKRRTAKSRKTATAVRRRRKTRSKKGNSRMVNFFVPLFFIVCILFCIGFISFVGYQTATASSFFDLQAVAIQGISRASRNEIEHIVKRHSIETGVWHADTEKMRKEVEEIAYVKRASVSRVLPNKFRVVVFERIPRAVVRIDGKDYWVDDDGLILSRVSRNEKRPYFTMFGWDKRDSSVAREKNQKRIALFVKLQKEWRKFDLASRVKAIDLRDLREPRAIVLDSGEAVTIHLGKEDFGKGLQRGLENIAGRGREVESIIVSGTRPVIEYRDS